MTLQFTNTARASADEAAETIAQASSNAPDSIELLSLLVNAYIQAEDPQHAEAAAGNLVSKDSSAYLRFVEVARLYVSADDIDAAVAVIAGISEQMLAEREDKQL